MRQGDGAVLREFAGVGEQVEEALAELGEVGVHGADVGWGRSSERLPFFSASGWTVRDDFVGIAAATSKRFPDRDPSCRLRSWKDRDGVDELQQVLAGAVDLLQVGNEVAALPDPAASSCSISL